MKIKYTKKRLNFNLFYGSFWLLLALVALYLNADSIFNYGYLALGAISLGIYIYEKKNQYLTIDNDTIKINRLFGKKIHLQNITQVRYVAGDYIITSFTTKLTINTQIIDTGSLTQLNEVLHQISIKPANI